DDDRAHPQPAEAEEQRRRGRPSHGFQIAGKRRKPATTTEPSYRSSCVRTGPAAASATRAERVAATARTASGTSNGKASAAKSVVAPRPWATIAASTVVAAARPS